MQKAYNRIVWHNKPDTRSPINESNLNRMDIGLDTVDDRVITLDTTKANQTDLLTCVASITFNQSTGILTITLQNGTSTTIDTGLSKLAVNFDYDDDPTSPHYEQLILEMKDGTYKYIDLSALINQFEFDNTTTVVFSVDAQTGHISAIVPDGSITESKLQPNFLADCRTEKTQAQAARVGAETAESNAEGFKEDAEAWANGEINGEPVPNTHPAYQNNAKYYKDLANPTTFKALTDVTTDQNFNGIDMSGIQDGQTVIFDSSTGEMVPGDAGGAAINDIFNVYGSKNLTPFPYYGPGNDPTIASIDEDGVITYNGQANGNTLVYMLNDPTMLQQFTLPVGRYILSIEVANAPSQSLGIITELMYRSPEPGSVPTTVQVRSEGSGKFSQAFTLPDNVYIIYMYTVFNGSATFSNTTIKPMLRRATVKDDTYVPPAYSNRQLTLKHNVKDMNDANINNPTPGQTLVYDSEGKLVNATPSGSGHTMINSAGTQLPQRTGLQGTGGLNVTDDSNNNRTVIDDDYEVIPWATWQGYSAAQKAQHPNAIVTGAPDCDGDVEIETMYLSWENLSPSSDFPQSAITLNDSACPNYTNIRIEYCLSTSNKQFNSIDVPINQTFNMGLSYLATSGINGSYVRVGTHNKSNKSIYFYGGWEITADGINYSRDDCIIPIRVYIYSKTLTAKIKAIAHDVSTSASKCMMSDDVTSVEDEFKLKLLFSGMVSFTNGAAVVFGTQFTTYTNNRPVIVRIGDANAPAIVSPYANNTDYFIILPISQGYSGPLQVNIYGFGWN